MPRRPAEREAVCNALIFKTNVLWVQLDALYHAYVEGHIPPGAFVPKDRASKRRTDGSARSRNISVSETSRPVLPRHAKLKFDETRQVWVILAPERVLAPDEIAVEVLQLCDGVRSVADMVDQLAAKYAAPTRARSRPTSSPCCRTLPTRVSSPKRARRRHERHSTDGKTAAAAQRRPRRRWKHAARPRRLSAFRSRCSPN